MAQVIDSDVVFDGKVGHNPYHTNIADMEGLICQALAQIAGVVSTSNTTNVTAIQGFVSGKSLGLGLQPSGDTTGVTDSAAVQALYNLGASTITLGAGTFALINLQPVSFSRLTGQGRGVTIVNNDAGATTKIFDIGHAQTDTVEIDHMTLSATGADIFGSTTTNCIRWHVHDCNLIQNSSGSAIWNGQIVGSGVMLECVFEKNTEHVKGATRTIEAWLLSTDNGSSRGMNQNIWRDEVCFNDGADASEYWYHILATSSINAENQFYNIVFEHPYGGMIHLESHAQGVIESCIGWDITNNVANHLIQLNKNSTGSIGIGNTIINSGRISTATFNSGIKDIVLDGNCPQTTIIAPAWAGSGTGLLIDMGGSSGVSLIGLPGTYTITNGPTTKARNIYSVAEGTNGILTIQNTTSSPTNPSFNIEAAAGADFVQGVRVTGDTNNRFRIDSNGKMSWGPGNAGLDTDLYRIAANQLATDDALFLGNQSQPATPTGGGVLFVNAGALKYIGSSGTVTTIANA